MRIPLAVLMLIAISVIAQTAFSEESWTYFGTNRMLDSYYNPGSVHHNDEQKMEVLIKQSYADRAKAMEFFKKFGVYDENLEREEYKTAVMVIDCEKKMSAVKSASSFGAGGEMLGSVNHQELNFVYIKDDSLFDLLYYEVCREK